MVRISETELPAFKTVIPVMVVESHRVFREGLIALLEEQADIKVVGQADNGRTAVDQVQKLNPAIILMDVAMPLLNGVEATRQILKILPTAKIILLSLYNNDAYLQQAMAMGASGCLTKETSMDDLLEGIRNVYKGRTFFTSNSPSFATPESKSFFREDSYTTSLAHLSSREVEILQLIAESLGNKQIAFELDISIKTVEKHRQSLMKKLDIHCAAGLTRFAIAMGIIESGAQLTMA